ncbi:type II CRISPR-associated endonuclease Cas1 [Sulfurimonas sp.]|jgi:CRISPR-associated protein Cas1|uniref:type II CRISPR-associated endonuclease Cas1 n=1 Tax=Sulfurimonas sp. TaxID=2022749 RepID=UPI0025CC8AA7|nr:type II CRISPR-associated endonuclease Cas1 [Sulfurimonas sp.]MCK9472754.1 type II CRISPR-associated endonuclease Cas1 [Sulfurimonas sp.]MDD3505475.1 type II CRISPR-associated endonuclease Cas1 [Sulfurimonas sp.]
MAAWRTILVTKPCRLSVKNLQFVYEPHNEESIKVPLEDITVIVLESNQATITTALLSQIAEKNIALFTCDGYHMPNGCFTPFHQHSRLSQIAHIQRDIKLPLKKQLWQKIITQKITNQSKLLNYFEIDNIQLELLKDKVKSGDGQNLEALAARKYWQKLFKDFLRDQKALDPRNIALNYGYAILRGAVARSLVSYGLLPTFGVFHNSELNAYNLADDMLEPLRPMTDMIVKKLELEDELDVHLGISVKSALINVLNMQMKLDGENVTLLHTCDVMAHSFVKSLKLNDANYLKLPTLS